MPTPTYDLIASNVLTSSASSVTFSSIPATYRDLIFVFSGSLSSGDNYDFIRFNGSSAANYNGVVMRGDGAVTGSSSWSSNNQFWIDGGANSINATNKTLIVQIFDYAVTDKHKTVLMRNSSPSQVVQANASRWASTAAVTSIYYEPNGSTIAAGSTFHLYGIVS